jgi:hypothetical protein
VARQTYEARFWALVAIGLTLVACGDNGEATRNAGTPDAGTPDAGTPDAGTPDAGTPDAGGPDATPDHTGVTGQEANLEATDGWPLDRKVALSASGNTLAVVGHTSGGTGGLFVFGRSQATWSQQAALYPFGNLTLGVETPAAVSANGDTLAMGDDSPTGNGNAVALFTWTDDGWRGPDFVDSGDGGGFGSVLALSASGDTLAVGAPYDGGRGNDSGAVYVFTRTEGTWARQAYFAASNTQAEDFFGDSVALSASGDTLAVGAVGEDGGAAGVGGDEHDNSATGSGAVYVFKRTGRSWAQQAYVKASNTEAGDFFGDSVALSASGDTPAVGASYESSSAVGVDGDQHDNGAQSSGAVYVFERSHGSWAQQAYVKASNTGASDRFGHSVALSSSGHTLAVGAIGEASSATGVNGDETDDSAPKSGAVYVLRRTDGAWAQRAYVKASNTAERAEFGQGVALSATADTLAVGTRRGGAVYVFH